MQHFTYCDNRTLPAFDSIILLYRVYIVTSFDLNKGRQSIISPADESPENERCLFGFMYYYRHHNRMMHDFLYLSRERTGIYVRNTDPEIIRASRRSTASCQQAVDYQSSQYLGAPHLWTKIVEGRLFYRRSDTTRIYLGLRTD